MVQNSPLYIDTYKKVDHYFWTSGPKFLLIYKAVKFEKGKFGPVHFYSIFYFFLSSGPGPKRAKYDLTYCNDSVKTWTTTVGVVVHVVQKYVI